MKANSGSSEDGKGLTPREKREPVKVKVKVKLSLCFN
jgi:hypothetical protein